LWLQYLERESMKTWTFAAIGMVASATGWAQDVGRVLSSTPVVQQVATPRQVCSNEQISYQGPKSGAGAVLGAIAGGAVGNAVGGRGAGQAAATAIGIMGGAILGDNIERPGAERVENVQRCVVQNVYETRTVGYDVVYEFGGRQYAVQMPHDPGPTIAVQVSPVGGAMLSQAPVALVQVQPAAITYVTVEPQRRYYAPPPAPYYAPYFPPLFVPLGIYGHQQRGHGFGHGHGHGREHRRW
jgi:uncharacterized protein YcfJ